MRRSLLRRSATPSWRGWWLQAALALCLLLSQQHAAVHWLSHAIAATHGKAAQHGGGNSGCDECAASTALGAGLAGTPPTLLPATAGTQRLAAHAATPHASAPALAYRSRAPPVAG